MTPSSNLFDIIHSLTASEKRYFKVFSSTHVIGTKNNYEKLFNAYCELPADEPYDEAAFKKKLSTKSWAKNFAVEKKFLEEILMKAMRAYNAEKTAEGQLNDIIANVHFLYNKGLVSAANKELQKGIKMAEDLESLPSLITLYQLKLNLTRITQTAADIKTAHEDLEAETRILTMLDAERKVVHTRRKVYNYYIGGQLKKNMVEAKAMLKELELLEYNQTLTYKATMSLFFIKAMVAEKEGRYMDAMQQYEQANAIWKKNELKLHESYSNLRTILRNYLICAYYVERYDVYPATIEQIESFPVESISDEADTFVVAKGAKLIYLLNTIESGSSGSIVLIEEIEQGLKKFQSQIPRQDFIQITSNICILHFRTQNYRGLISSLNNAFSIIGRDEKMHHLLLELKFFEIMAHYSLKNYDLLDYQIRNTDRWIREHKLIEPFIELLLKSFTHMNTEAEYSKTKNQLIALDTSQGMQMLKMLVLEWMEVNRPILGNPRSDSPNANLPAKRSRR